MILYSLLYCFCFFLDYSVVVFVVLFCCCLVCIYCVGLILGILSVSSSGFAGGMVTCTDPPDDFMLADGYSYTPENVEVYLDNRQFFVMAGSDPDVPMGIYVYTGCLDLTADYVLTISISCCSRQ